MNQYRHILDLALTPMEFEGMDYALRYYANRLLTLPLVELTEDDLLLGKFYGSITPDRRAIWSDRSIFRTRHLRDGQPRRYSFKVDLLLVRALYRVLGTRTIGYDTAAFRARMHLVLTRVHQTGRTTHHVGFAGVVEVSEDTPTQQQRALSIDVLDN